jgi:8-oxo-dGTP pyrophosphatase MutT (NUDIX family)
MKIKVGDLKEMIREALRSGDLPRAACVLLKKGDRYLSVSRRDNPDTFGLPGGKVDPGEDDETAARRECKEETGLDAEELRFLFAGRCEATEDDGVDYWTTTYVGDYSGEINTDEEGVVRWVTKEDLIGPKSPFASYNQRLFDMLDAK